MSDSSKYTRTYTTFSGCDIVVSFGDTVIGELQAISYSVSREKAPVYTMGNADPRSFSRGKRGIAGTLVFTVFNKDALMSAFENEPVYRVGPRFDGKDGPTYMDSSMLSIDDWDKQMTKAAQGISSEDAINAPNRFQQRDGKAYYADELPPFDVTISFQNEYGQKSVMVIYGVEILNEGMGFSIDSITSEKACTFVARALEGMKDAGSVHAEDTSRSANKSNRD